MKVHGLGFIMLAVLAAKGIRKGREGKEEIEKCLIRVCGSQGLCCLEMRSKVYKSTETIRKSVGGLSGRFQKTGINDLTITMVTPVKNRTGYASRAGGCGGSPF